LPRTLAERTFENPASTKGFLVSIRFALVEPRRGVLRLSGPARVDFLQGLVSNDVTTVSPEHGIWAALLTPQGKYLHDFFVTASDETLLIEAEGERIGDLRKRLSMYRLRTKVEIEDVTGAMEVWQIWGDGAASALGLGDAGSAIALDGGTVLADPRHADLGARAVLPSGAALFDQKGFVPGDFTEWDQQRIALGIPDGSRDMVIDKSLLLENGFDELRGVSFTKGCYVGQEITARTKHRGLVKKRLLPVRVDGPAPAPGTTITRSDGSEAGEIRSVSGAIALALLRLDALNGPLVVGGSTVIPDIPSWAVLPSTKPLDPAIGTL
jgi:folate-binding protein YgfZ